MRTEKEYETRFGICKNTNGHKQGNCHLRRKWRNFFINETPWIILKNGSRFDIKQANQTKDYQYTVFDTYRMSLENPPKTTHYKKE